jgi:hypothetical protein
MEFASTRAPPTLPSVLLTTKMMIAAVNAPLPKTQRAFGKISGNANATHGSAAMSAKSGRCVLRYQKVSTHATRVAAAPLKISSIAVYP